METEQENNKFIRMIKDGDFVSKPILINKLTTSFGNKNTSIKCPSCVDDHAFDLVFMQQDDLSGMIHPLTTQKILLNGLNVIGMTKVEHGDIISIGAYSILYYVNEIDENWKQLSLQKKINHQRKSSSTTIKPDIDILKIDYPEELKTFVIDKYKNTLNKKRQMMQGIQSQSTFGTVNNGLLTTLNEVQQKNEKRKSVKEMKEIVEDLNKHNKVEIQTDEQKEKKEC